MFKTINIATITIHIEKMHISNVLGMSIFWSSNILKTPMPTVNINEHAHIKMCLSITNVSDFDCLFIVTPRFSVDFIKCHFN